MTKGLPVRSRRGAMADLPGSLDRRDGDILVCDQRWQEVLEVAGLGLELDPAHTGCANVRACALGRLRQPAEGEDAVTEALVVNAEDALSHATRGWLLLRQ